MSRFFKILENKEIKCNIKRDNTAPQAVSHNTGDLSVLNVPIKHTTVGYFTGFCDSYSTPKRWFPEHLETSRHRRHCRLSKASGVSQYTDAAVFYNATPHVDF